MNAQIRNLLIVFFLLITIVAKYVLDRNQKTRSTLGIHNQNMSPVNSSPSGYQTCDISLWQHVYNPQRLHLIDPCKTVTGTIEEIRTEEDGDYHIRLKLDPDFKNLINDKNSEDQEGDLILEPVCERPVYQEDAQEACRGFAGQIKIPQIRSHVQVMGSYVLDTDHGWMEIHPVSQLIVIP